MVPYFGLKSEFENAIEVDYDARAREYTIISSFRESRSSWMIHSVVVVDSILNTEKKSSNVTSHKSGGIPHFRALRNKQANRETRKRYSALDRYRSFSSDPSQKHCEVRESSISIRRLRQDEDNIISVQSHSNARGSSVVRGSSSLRESSSVRRLSAVREPSSVGGPSLVRGSSLRRVLNRPKSTVESNVAASKQNLVRNQPLVRKMSLMRNQSLTRNISRVRNQSLTRNVPPVRKQSLTRNMSLVRNKSRVRESSQKPPRHAPSEDPAHGGMRPIPLTKRTFSLAGGARRVRSSFSKIHQN